MKSTMSLLCAFCCLLVAAASGKDMDVSAVPEAAWKALFSDKDYGFLGAREQYKGPEVSLRIASLRATCHRAESFECPRLRRSFWLLSFTSAKNGDLFVLTQSSGRYRVLLKETAEDWQMSYGKKNGLRLSVDENTGGGEIITRRYRFINDHFISTGRSKSWVNNLRPGA